MHLRSLEAVAPFCNCRSEAWNFPWPCCYKPSSSLTSAGSFPSCLAAPSLRSKLSASICKGSSVVIWYAALSLPPSLSAIPTTEHAFLCILRILWDSALFSWYCSLFSWLYTLSRRAAVSSLKEKTVTFLSHKRQYVLALFPYTWPGTTLLLSAFLPTLAVHFTFITCKADISHALISAPAYEPPLFLAWPVKMILPVSFSSLFVCCHTWPWPFSGSCWCFAEIVRLTCSFSLAASSSFAFWILGSSDI